MALLNPSKSRKNSLEVNLFKQNSSIDNTAEKLKNSDQNDYFYFNSNFL